MGEDRGRGRAGGGGGAVEECLGQEFEAFDGVAGAAPEVGGQGEGGRSGASPGKAKVGGEGVEIEREVGGERADEGGVFARAVASGGAGEGQCQVAFLRAGGREAEDVETVADLRFLEVAEEGVEAGEVLLLVACQPGVC